ncbi:ester cyclase [Mesorhizobium sp. ANAO-SY3R2]|uniref:ester cyclase n=1 Tax=Mesorhizobium sp. ANAO-SY3R2 TaxID=3166644 RepID=UPI00366D7250
MHRRQFLASSALATALLATAPAILPAFAQGTPQAVIEAYVAAWNAHDSAKAADHFAEEVVYYDASVGKPAEGKETAKVGVIDNFLNAVPDAVWKMKGKPVVQDDKVAFEWEFSGTNTGDWADGTKSTGKKFSFPGVSVFSVKDGKIVSQSDYYDALSFYKQLGLM